MFSTIKTWLYAIVAGAVALLFSWLKLEQRKNRKLKEELQKSKQESKIKDFKATEAKIESEAKDEKDDIKPNSTITL